MDDDQWQAIRIVAHSLGKEFEPDPMLEAAAKVDFGPGFDELFEEAVHGARHHKEEAVINGPVDLEDLCQVIVPQGSFSCPISDMMEQGMSPSQSIALSIAILTMGMGQPIAVMVLCERVYRIAKDLDEPPPVRGSLAEAWYDGKRDGLYEALSVTVATPERCASELLPYHYGDGSIVWEASARREEEGWPTNPVRDEVLEAIQMAFSVFIEEGGGDGPEQS